ncbi:hypothetical protein HHI36_001430 [Cryptolaemus montrouzieri]|uniref:Protein LTV1 homolog n=1 Tax=Cryptolaemus montrouzieri TaxID=559131 RepID=A0ABD2P7Z0_9CUCU
MPKKKKFIDKKRAVTFQLVHRSQQDPLVADENAPQRVLLPIKEKELAEEREKRIEEQHKYGIYFNDDENYLEKLKDPKDNQVEWPEHVEEEIEKRKLKLNLPNEVFASTVEEEVGMLNKAMPVAGPQLHLDPDIVAAMDEDFDFDDPENQLEDNFIELAEGLASDQEFDENDEDNYFSSDFDERSEENDALGTLPGSNMFEEEETRSRFTSYSMSSSVIRRNEQLTLLDDRFEKMYAEYDDNEMGALDCDEIEGYVPESSETLIKYADEFIKSKQKEHLEKDDVISKMKERLENISDSESEDEMIKMAVNEGEKWDCETILSTYSNIYNHPRLITEPKKSRIKINPRTGMPMDVLGQNKLTVKTLNKLNEEHEGYESRGTKSVGAQSIISHLSTLSIRPKDETPEDRKERKKALKEYRKERKLEKKLNTQAFKEEAKRQVKIAINNRNNVQGNKIM